MSYYDCHVMLCHAMSYRVMLTLEVTVKVERNDAQETSSFIFATSQSATGPTVQAFNVCIRTSVTIVAVCLSVYTLKTAAAASSLRGRSIGRPPGRRPNRVAAGVRRTARTIMTDSQTDRWTGPPSSTRPAVLGGRVQTTRNGPPLARCVYRAHFVRIDLLFNSNDALDVACVPAVPAALNDEGVVRLERCAAVDRQQAMR